MSMAMCLTANLQGCSPVGELPHLSDRESFMLRGQKAHPYTIGPSTGPLPASSAQPCMTIWIHRHTKTSAMP